MKALILTRYEMKGASSRLRTFQYSKALRMQGVDTLFQPFFDDRYLERLYTGQSTYGPVLRAYTRRLATLPRKGDADVIWLEKEALPWLPWPFERAFLSAKIPLVVDYDDAAFHRYDLHRYALVRNLLGQKLNRLMASASLVTAGNRYLADKAVRAGAPRVEIVPTVVDMAAYTKRQAPVAGNVPVIGWIGTPGTWSEYMAPIMPVLEKAALASGAVIMAVGAGRAAASHPLLDVVAWYKDSEIAQIHAMDIGIMPLTDTPWARGKCGYKLIQYMACGLPVIASPVGVNAEIVEHGVNGFLATSEKEWTEALQTLLHDPALRLQMGQEGRRKVAQHYSLQVWGPRVAQMLRDTAAQGRKNYRLISP
jgi:glycosyltransferase involved in cell wall biosynthesis